MNEVIPALSPSKIERIAMRRPLRSLRWRLQAWHALLLTGVLTVFGLVVYALAWQSRLQQIDPELDRTAVVITSRLRRLMPWPMPFPWPQPPRGAGPDRWQPPARPENDLANRSEPGPQRPDEPNGRIDRGPSRRDDSGGRSDRYERRPRSREESDFGPVSALVAINASHIPNGPRDVSEPREQTSGTREKNGGRDPSGPRDPNAGRGPRPGEFPAPSLGLPEEFLHLFEGEEDSRLYFVVWDREGKVLQKSDSAVDIPFPGLHVGEDKLPVRVVRVRDSHREVVHVSSWDVNVLVGRSMVKDLAAQHASGALLALAGLAVLAAGLVGGWWTSSRAIRPIASMTAAAESISAQRLSQRIDVQETDNELGQLATVLNRTFDRLQASFEQQTRFTADASHELRTPLSVILAHADLALSRERTPEEYRATLETCRSASRRMKALIEGLLTLARFDSDAAELQFTELNIESVIRDCIDLVRPLATERRITITADIKPVIMRGDRERLSQVIINLLTNAIRYNREDGKVQVSVDAEDGVAVIAVTDTGIGIPADELPRIFDRFYRVDKARSRAEGSSGLGLSISQTIVAFHGGTIVATSKPDVGTTMQVRLPINKHEMAGPSSSRTN
jgi:heavy metal sensor kinase